MKKLLLTALLVAIGIAGKAQFNYFTSTLEYSLNGLPSTAHKPVGTASTRMPDGRIMLIRPADSLHIEISTIGLSGNPQDAHLIAVPWAWLKKVSYAYALGSNKIIVTGYYGGSGSGTDVYFALCVNLDTWEIKSVERNGLGLVYTNGPKVSVGDDAVYICYPDYSRVTVEKFDMDFNSLWIRSCSPDSLGRMLKFPSMACTVLPDGSVCTVEKDDHETSMTFLDSEGNFIKRHLFPDMDGWYMRPYSVMVTQDGGFLISAQKEYSNGHPALLKLNADLSVQWARVLDSTLWSAPVVRFVDAKELPDGRIAAFGSTTELYWDNYYNTVSYFEADGDWISTVVIDDTDKNYRLYGAEVYADGILMTGGYRDLSNDLFQVVINTSFDLSSVCDTLMLHTVATDLFVGSSSISADSMYIFTLDGGPGAPLSAATSAAPTLDLCNVVVANDDALNDQVFTVSPCPQQVGEDLQLQLPAGTAGLEYSLTDLQGRVVRSGSLSAGTTRVPTAGLSTGVYHLEVTADQWVGSQKVVLVR
jgi:hypothetical protein